MTRMMCLGGADIGQPKRKSKGMAFLKSASVHETAPCSATDASLGSASSNEEDEMDRLVGLQKVDGHWSLNKELVRLATCGQSDDVNVILAIKNKCIDSSLSEDAFATLLAVTLLRRRFADRRDEWEMLEKKAVSFVLRCAAAVSVTLDDKSFNNFVDSLASLAAELKV